MKLYRNLIIVTIIVAILGVAMYFVTTFEPSNNNEITTDQTIDQGMLEIYKANSDDVLKINIKNTEEEYTLSQNGNNWIMNGDASILLDQGAVKSLVNTCTFISAKSVVAQNSENAPAFGLSTPTCMVEIIFKNNVTKKIYVGNKTLDNQDYYIMLSDDDKIYLKNAYGTESMIPASNTLRNLSLISMDTTDLNAIKEFNMTVQGSTPVKLKNISDNPDESGRIQWKMIAPVYAEVNGQIFSSKIIECFEDFRASAVIEDHPKNLSVYGLDQPYAEFTIADKNAKYTMQVGAETDTYRFLKQVGYDTVYTVSKEHLSFLNVAYKDLMSELIHVEYISEIEKVEFVLNNQKFELLITENDKGTEYKINNTKLPKETFSKAYQAIIGICLDNVDLNNPPSTTPNAYIKYMKKDKSLTTVHFLPINERNYRVTINGKGNSVTNKKNVENVAKKIEEIIKSAQ